jgi:predicted SnoaL-like aldol condensation-catalyzing enzyme
MLCGLSLSKGDCVSAEKNKALVRRTIEEVINQGKLDLADELFADDHVYRSPGTPDMRGPDGFKQLITGYRTAFPDLHMTLTEVIAEGNTVACSWTATGKHRW